MNNNIEEFRKIISKSKKNNTYKFALAKFLLDYSKECQEIKDTKIEYRVIAQYFLDYYWEQVCKHNIKQVSSNQNTPIVVTIIQDYCDKESINRGEIVQEIAKKCFKDVIPRFQYQNGTFYRHYHEVQNRGYKMPLDEKRYICLFKESIELFRDNYEVLCDEVLGELERFLGKSNFIDIRGKIDEI
jgi:hypothetical protein